MSALPEVVESAVFTREFVESVRVQAELDADAVAEFLRNRGLLPGNDGQVPFATEALLGIGLALRIRRWELNRIRVHSDAGIPTSAEVFERIVTLVCGPDLEKYIHQHCVRAIQVLHDSFLWSANGCNLTVDIAIVADEDEEFLDKIVDFLIQQIERAVGG